MLVCPECGSQRTWKDGLRYVQGASVQRFICRSCGYRFSDPSLNVSKDPECNQNVHRMALNMPSSLLSNRQICALETERVKNLVKVETRTETALRESTRGDIISFAWHLKKIARRETTIETYSKFVEVLSKISDLKDPDSVKLAIATHFKNQNTKRSACCAYDAYLKYAGGQWEKPNYKQEHTQVFIPTNEEIQLAINSGKRTSVIFSHFIYETGARVNEAERLEWTDLNREQNNVTVKASKNGKARTIPISQHLISMLFSLPKKGKTVFPKRARGNRQIAFRTRLITLSKIHDNPRLKKIHFHTLRHCKALREYHKTLNMQRVKRILGHKSILTTQRYVELYEELYENTPRETVCEIALNIQEAKKLIEQGFKYETGEYHDGGKLFSKYK